MTFNLGDRTTLLQGINRKGGQHSADEADYIVIDGFCQEDHEHWTSSGGLLWPHKWLLAPNTRVLLASNCLVSDPSIKNLLQYGQTLLDVINRYLSNAPLVVHCFGLGGILFLQALKLSHTRDSGRTISSKLAGVVFYGTPLVAQEVGTMKRTIQDCLTAELQSAVKMDVPIDDRTMEQIEHLLHLANNGDFPTFAFYELEETNLNRRGLAKFGSRKKILVHKSLVQSGDRRCVGLQRDHASIARLEQSDLAKLLGEIDRMLSQYRQRQGAAYSQAETQSVSPASESSQTLQAPNPIVPSTVSGVPESSDTRIQRDHIKKTLHKIDLPDNVHFYGREDILEKLKTALQPGVGTSNDSRAYAIHGAQGTGKTQTALRFAYSQTDVYHYIFWVSSETESKLLQGFSEYAELLGLRSKETPADHLRDADNLKKWFEATENPWLIIFDNAEDTSLILDYWPLSRWGAIIVTSVESTFAGPDYCEQGAELFQLDEEPSIRMLLVSLSLHDPSSADHDLAGEIVRRVGCLPVAIRTCIGQIRESSCSLKEYNKEWNDPRSIINKSARRYVDSRHARYQKSLLELYAKSVRDLNRDARSLVNIFALMDDEHIPYEMFQNESAFGEVYFLRRVSGIIIDLTRSSLIGREATTESSPSPRYHIHRMVRTFIQMQMDAAARQYAFESAAILLDKKIVEGPKKTFADNKSYFQHVESLWKFYTEEAERFREDSTLTPLVPSLPFVRSLRKMSWWCYRVSFHTSAKNFMVTINEICDHKERLEAGLEVREGLEVEAIWNHYQHACLHTDLGNFNESLTYFERCLELYNAAPESRKSECIMAYVIYGGIGNSYNGLRRQVQAEEYYKKSLEVMPEGIMAFNNYELNICRALYDQGPQRFAEASSRVEEIIRRREDAYGPDDHEHYLSALTFYIAGNLRLLQAEDPSPNISQEQRQKYLDEAYEFHTKSLKVSRLTFGMGHHKTADACIRYSWHLDQRGHRDEAINSLKEALSIFEQAANREHRQAEIARTAFKMSLIFEKQGKEDQAERARSKAEEIRKKTLKERFRPSEGLRSYDALVSHWQL